MQRVYTMGFRKLIAWQEAKSLTLKIYALTTRLPKEEQFHLVMQLRRASASVMANIAEGSAMPTKANRDSYYWRARASAVEVDCFIELCVALKYLDDESMKDVQDHCARITFLLTQLVRSK